MVDNTIALRVQTPQLESPINRMAKFMQLQAYKAQADTAQQTTAKNAMLNQAYAAAVDPKSGAIDYNKAAAFLAANGGGAYAPDVLSSGAAATTAETGAAKGKFELKRSQIEASVRDLASYKTPEDATAHLERSVAAGLVDPQTATALAAEIPRDPAQFEGWRTAKVRSLLTAAQQLETKFDAQNFGGGQRTIAYPAYAGGGGATVVPGSEVANTISPDAASSARTAAENRANALELERLRQGAPKTITVGNKVVSIRQGENGQPVQTEVPLAGVGQTPTQVENKRDTDALRVLLGSMMEDYAKLNAGGGIKSGANSGLGNLMAGASSSAVGQTFGNLFSTENAQARNNIERTKKQLIDTLGLTTARLNTMPELNLWLSTFGSPGESVENSVKAYETMAATHNAKHPDFPLPPTVGELVSPEAAANLLGGAAAPANSLVVITPDGQAHEFPTPAAADAYRQELAKRGVRAQ